MPNGTTGLGPDGESVPTLLDIAKDRGMATGLVDDHDVTNATLAGFGSPVEPGRIPDVGEDDVSEGESNLVERAQGDGYQHAWNETTFDELSGPKALASVQDSAKHTGTMVPVTAAGPLAEKFTGVHPHTHVYDVVMELLGN